MNTIISMTPRVLLFSTMAFILAPVAVFASHGVAPLVAVGAVFCLADRQVRQALHPKRQPFFIYLLLLALLWALVSVSWTLDPNRALRVVGGLTALLVIARVLAAGVEQLTVEERGGLARNLVLAGCLLGVVLTFENLTNGLITRLFHHFPGKNDDHMASLNSGSAVLAVLAWPFAVAVARWRGWRWAIAWFVLVAGVLFISRTNTPLVALCVSGLLFLMFVRAGRWATYGFTFLSAGYLVASPFIYRWLLFPVEASERFSRLISPWYPGGERLILLKLSSTWEYRTWIWRFVVEHIEKKLFLGWGMDSSRFIEGGREPVHGYEAFAVFPEVLPLHPHNGFLQIWLELGAIGAVLIAAALAVLLLAIPRATEDKLAVAAYFSLAATYLAMGQVSFGIWQNWWLSTVIVALTFLLAVQPIPAPPERIRRHPKA
jgi:exopolysaccharide production protein ExoQ